jgi:undecaprenyl-diphosphatase
MTLFQSIVLGAVQGVTEFLPISSTAHLALTPWFFGWEDPGLGFDVALHLGTLVALLLYFRAEWFQLAQGGMALLRGERHDPKAKLLLLLILGTIPALIAGAAFAGFAETTLRSPLVIASTLIVLALVLVAAERWGRHHTKLEDMTVADALAVGCAQALAIIPGVSRSGVTITAGLFRNMTREASARFSFFLSTPIIGAAVSKAIVDGIREGFPSTDTTSLIVGIVVSGIVGYLSIAFLLRYLATHSTYVFIFYRIALGFVIIAAYAVGLR